MSTLAHCAGADGEPHKITHNGKTYSFSVVTWAIKDAMAEALFALHCQTAARMRYTMTEAEYRDRLDALHAGFLKGEYGFQTEAMAGYLQTERGFMTLLSKLCGVDPAEADALYWARPVEVQAAVKLVMELSFPKAEGSDPNGQAPETTATFLANALKRYSRLF